ncbi:amine oxidase, partial [Mycobacterium tuberculosis]
RTDSQPRDTPEAGAAQRGGPTRGDKRGGGAGADHGGGGHEDGAAAGRRAARRRGADGPAASPQEARGAG